MAHPPSSDPGVFSKQLEEQRKLIEVIDNEISTDEARKLEIFKELNQIQSKTEDLDLALEKMTSRKESLDTLIREISKGFEKIQASTHSLYLLSSRQLKMLKRKYPLNP